MTQPDDTPREGGGPNPPTPPGPPNGPEGAPQGGADLPPSGGLGGDPTWLHRHDRPASSGSASSGPASSGPVSSEPSSSGPAADGTSGGTSDGAPDDAEILDGDQPGSSTADALLAEVFDASELEAEMAAVESESEAVSGEVASLTADLQRLHAEYSNYRKRVERDRELVRERAIEGALAGLFPVLDDLELAGQHGELVGGFKSVAEKLVAALSALGLSAFGAEGESFVPTRHEALMREDVEGVTEPTVVRVLAVGYEMNGRVLRAARVSVAGTD